MLKDLIKALLSIVIEDQEEINKGHDTEIWDVQHKSEILKMKNIISNSGLFVYWFIVSKVNTK